MSEKSYEYRAGMTCDGCKNAISRILSKTPGVTSFDADVPSQRLVVRGNVTPEVISERLSKWSNASGKELTFVKEL